MTNLMSEGIDEATMLALGRVAWTAVNVESKALLVAERILGVTPETPAVGHHPASAYIKRAIDELSSQPKDFVTRLGVQYLENSLGALVERNKILHSIHVTVFVNDPPEQSLLYFPTDPKKGAPEMFPLVAATLNAKADEFAAIYADTPQFLGVVLDLPPAERVQLEGHFNGSIA